MSHRLRRPAVDGAGGVGPRRRDAWAVENLFELAKGDCGLSEYEVRGWVGWHRHVTLSLFAVAVLAVIRSRAAKRAGRGRAEWIPLTVPEVRRLVLRVVWDRLTPAE